MFKSPKATGQLNYHAGLREGHFDANISCGGMGVGKWVTCDFIFLTYTVKSTSDFSVSKCDHFSAKWRVRVSSFLKGPLSIRFWFLSAVLQIRRVSPGHKENVIAPELNGTGNSAFMRLPPGVFGNESVHLQFLFTDLSLEILQTKSVTRWRLNPRTILGDPKLHS